MGRQHPLSAEGDPRWLRVPVGAATWTRGTQRRAVLPASHRALQSSKSADIGASTPVRAAHLGLKAEAYGVRTNHPRCISSSTVPGVACALSG
jgi:hypothetical protein